ncbi:hypothetical protein VNO77_02921 [Canavalia gladiata]|uniref:Uncharacterized protein n=1 Tax=Canavalia gladiata TaxID=3824 RepID=A0AAN9RBQ9_CANGL
MPISHSHIFVSSSHGIAWSSSQASNEITSTLVASQALVLHMPFTARHVQVYAALIVDVGQNLHGYLHGLYLSGLEWIHGLYIA